MCFQCQTFPLCARLMPVLLRCREEDFALGGIVVEDCLHLIGELLRGNAANLRSFRELGFYDSLLKLIQDQCSVLQKKESEVSPEWANNLAAALGVLEVCLADAAGVASGGRPGGVLAASGPARGQQESMLRVLAAFACHPIGGAHARAAAWRCLESASHDTQAKAWLAGTKAEVGLHAGSLLAMAALHAACAPEAPAEEYAAASFVALLCSSNPALQAALAAQLTAETGPHSQVLASLAPQGVELPQLLQSSRVAAVLTALVLDNAEVKQQLLNARVAPQGQGVMAACAQRLASCVTTHGAREEAQYLVSNYSIFLASWIHGFPAGTAAFLDSIRQTPFLVGVLLTAGQFGAGSAIIRGMCAVLLGLCCVHAPAGSAVDPAVLRQAVSGQVGFPRYQKALEELLADVQRPRAPPHPQLLCSLWARSLDAVARGLMQSIMGTPAPSPAPVPAPAATPPISPPVHAPPSMPNGRGAGPAAPPPAAPQRPLANSVTPLSQPPAPMPSALPALHALPGASPRQGIPPTVSPSAVVYDDGRMGALEAEMARLKQRNAELEREVGDARASLSQMRAACSKAEADLEGLSTAYAALDSHANALQAQLDALQSKSPRGTEAQDVAALVQAAREEAEKDASAAMEDLLVCLGQEEAKVAELEARLKELQAR